MLSSKNHEEQYILKALQINDVPNTQLGENLVAYMDHISLTTPKSHALLKEVTSKDINKIANAGLVDLRRLDPVVFDNMITSNAVKTSKQIIDVGVKEAAKVVSTHAAIQVGSKDTVKTTGVKATNFINRFVKRIKSQRSSSSSRTIN